MVTLVRISLRTWLAGAVTGDKSESTVHRIRRTYADKGIKVCCCQAVTCPLL